MAEGPGKYDDVCTVARESTNAQAAMVIILNGDRGSGFSVQAYDQMSVDVLGDILEHILKQMRKTDASQALEVPTMTQAKRGELIEAVRSTQHVIDAALSALECPAPLVAAAPNMLVVLNACRIMLKNRDQRPEEMKLLDAIKMVIAQAEGAEFVADEQGAKS